MKTEGFDGQFAVGSVRGLRGWTGTSADGALIGAYGGIWGDGENTAQCSSARWYIPGIGHAAPRPAPHPAPSMSCGCGLWAYWDDSWFLGREWYYHFQFAGVIEGYGRTLIGAKGFRCEKARILGLYSDSQPALARLRVPNVPVYQTLDELLAAHPLTEDYAA